MYIFLHCNTIQSYLWISAFFSHDDTSQITHLYMFYTPHTSIHIIGVLVKDLLDKGVTVNAAIRDPSKTDRLKYLTDVADASKGSIKFFKADLLEEGSYLEAIKGCSVVFHTASPFMTDVPKGKEQEMLLDPASQGN